MKNRELLGTADAEVGGGFISQESVVVENNVFNILSTPR
jgi:hypothetical protein